MDDKNYPKKPKIYFCESCNFNTFNKKDYNRHLATLKHTKETQGIQNDDITTTLEQYICECGNQYKYRQGLWKHKKICAYPKKPTSEMTLTEQCEIKILTDLVKEVMKQNQDLTNKIVDMCKTGNISHNNVNSHNKTFNLQFFLNETCKDAMNISDFVDSIQLQLSDLERVGQYGFVEGISEVVIDNLKDLDKRQRPIHCSDLKREIIYIKDNNKWIKNNEPHDKMSIVIKQIANKNMKNITEWVKNNPDCYDSSSKKNDKYLKIVSNSMSGGTELEQKTNINKIISRVAKKITIDKNA